MKRIAGFCALVCSGFTTTALADPPDAKVNPQSGLVEVVDSHQTVGGYDIRHTIEHDPPEQSVSAEIGASSANDLSPRIEINPLGDTFVVWYRDLTTDEIRIRRREYFDGSWGADTRISDSSEEGRNPEIEYAGGTPWIVYEIHGSSSRSIAVVGISDDPEPIPLSKTVVRTTPYAGNVDATIRAQSGHLWVTWIDSSSDVGFSEYDFGDEEWSAPQYESYGSDYVGAARQRIHDTVLGL